MEMLKAAREHLDELAPLFSAYRRFYEQEVDADAEFDYLSSRMSGEDCTVFLARESGQAVGFVLLYPTFDSVMLGPVWVLHDLFVAPGSRKTGVGRKLMQTAHDFCKKQGAMRVDLATAVSNTVAQPLYESLGYERDDEFYYYSLDLQTGDL